MLVHLAHLLLLPRFRVSNLKNLLTLRDNLPCGYNNSAGSRATGTRRQSKSPLARTTVRHLSYCTATPVFNYQLNPFKPYSYIEMYVLPHWEKFGVHT